MKHSKNIYENKITQTQSKRRTNRLAKRSDKQIFNFIGKIIHNKPEIPLLAIFTISL